MAQSDKSKQPAKQPEEPPKRRNRSEPVAREASFVGSAAFARAGFRDPTLILRWEQIVGPEVARIARPLKLSEGAAGGILTLKAEPGAAMFLQYETRTLCERINAYLGRPTVAKLRFVQGPLPVKTIHKPVARSSGAISPDDPALRYKGRENLRDALLNLARARQKND